MSGWLNESNFDCINSTSSNLDTKKYVICSSNIGFMSNEIIGHAIFSIISIIGLATNILVIINTLKKRSSQKSKKTTAMELLFKILTIIDLLISIYWIISSLIFYNAFQIKEYNEGCAILSLVYIFIFNFQFIFLNFILHHFKKINMNPIEGILRPTKNILFYVLAPTIFSGILCFFSLKIKLIGRSPLMTCFINTNVFGNMSVFVVPLICSLYAIYQIIKGFCCSEMFITDKGVRQIYKKQSVYVFFFCLLHTPLFLLFIIRIFNKDNTSFHWLVVLTTIVTICIPLVMSLYRLFNGFSKLEMIKNYLSKKKLLINKEKTIQDYRMSFSMELTSALNYENQFEWLEKHAMEFFMRDILVGVATCLKKSTSYSGYFEKEKLDPKEILKHNINLENFDLDDQTVKSSDYLGVNIIEYAPKCFSYLRSLEEIYMDQMINSFLPKNNRRGIEKSQGKSGSFFISTDDNKFMIKTLKADEFELIRHTFLKKYMEYLADNPNSLMCRLYGMYNIKMGNGDEMLIIVMRNVIGDFKDNVVAQFDLKGSTFQRISQFDVSKVTKETMKDLNFNEIELGIMIDQQSINQLREAAKKDSEFLKENELMDYSLFLVKITLSKEESIDIFGDKILELQEANSKKFTDSINNDDQQESCLEKAPTNVFEIKKSNIVFGVGEIHDIKCYRQHIFPSLTQGQGYIIGIIDYFQYFNFYKTLESRWKTSLRKNGKKIISCVNPKEYSARFINYVEQLTDLHTLFQETNNENNNIKSK